MPISTKIEGKKIEINCEGRFVASAVQELEEELQKIPIDGLDEMVVNMEQTEYISSKGIRVIMNLFHRMNGKKVSVVHANDAVKEIFKITGLDQLIEVD